MSEKLHAVAQQNNRPFVQVAASIKRRTYRSRDKVAVWTCVSDVCFCHVRERARPIWLEFGEPEIDLKPRSGWRPTAYIGNTLPES